MPYIGNQHNVGDHVNNFKVLDDISSYTATFDGSATSVVSTSAETIRIPEHRFIQGQRVTYNNGGGSNIGGLTSGTAYYVSFDSANTVKLATSLANANTNTVINLSTVGGGTSHSLNAAFDGVNTKFKLTFGSGNPARLNNATQINVAINNVIQRPNLDANNFTDGFALADNHKIVFKTAPTSQDIFWGSIIANTIENFDLRDNEVDNFTGNGSITEFTLSTIPANNESVIVTIDGVLQHPSDKDTTRAYTLIDSILQFTAAPALNAEIQARHIGFAGASTPGVSGFYGRTGNVVLGSTDHITTGDITARNINASGILTAASASFGGNVSIGGTLTYEDVTNIDSVGLVTAREGIFIPDNKKLELGNAAGSGDLQIYHDSNQSYIVDNGTGQLYIRGSAAIHLENSSGSEKYFRGVANGAAELYHDGELKILTKANGATIQDLTATGVYLDITSSSGNNGKVYGVSGTTIGFLDSQNHWLIKGIKDGAVELNHDNLKRFETTTTGIKLSSSLASSGGISNMLQLDNLGNSNGDGSKLTFSRAGTIRTEIEALKNETANNETDIVFRTTNAGSLGEKLRIASDGKVGIGTAAPSSKLHLSGTGQNTLRIDSSASAISIHNHSEFMGYIGNDSGKFYLNAGGTEDTLSLRTGGTEKLLITSNGRVGINSSIPTHKLDVAGHIKVDGGPVLENASTISDSLKITTSTGYVEVGSQNTNHAHFYTDRQRFYFNKRVIVDEGIIGSFNEDLVLATDVSEERIRIKNDTGYVGIGITNPTHPLVVRNSSNTLGIFTSTDSGGNIDLFDDTAQSRIRTVSGRLHLYSDFGNSVADSSIRFFVDGNNERLSITSDGKVGINQAPTRELSLHSPDNNNALIHFTNDDTGETASDGILIGLNGNEDCIVNNQESGKNIIFYTHNGSSVGERLRILSDGKVLIGHTTNIFNYKLAVFGTDGGHSGISASRFSNNTSPASLILSKSRSATIGNFAVLQDDDEVGMIDFRGADGTDNNSKVAEIKASIDGTPGSNDMPGRLSFHTTQDGASSTTERLRIASDGRTTFYGTNELDIIHVTTGNAAGNTFVNIRGDNEAGIRIRGGGSYDGGTIELAGGLRNSDPGIIKFSTGTGSSVNERMRIDKDGYVTKPYNAMFKARRTSNQSVSSNGWHIIQFNSDTGTGCFDVGNNFSTSNHRFTAPVTGYYQFGLNMRVDGGNGDYFRVAFSVDGDVKASDNYPYGHAIYKDTDGFSYYSFSITALNYLTAGQYVRAEAYSSSDSSWTLQDESIFYGYLVG